MTPLVTVSIDGKTLAAIDNRSLGGQIVEYDGERADELKLDISNYDGKLKKPSRDQTVSVELGFKETGVQKAGTFTILDVCKRGSGAVFEITGHAADLKKTLKEQKQRSFLKGKTLGDIIRTIAADNGLIPAVSERLAAIRIERIIAQTNESDMHFVTRLARQYGALGKIAEGRLVFVDRGAGMTASGKVAETLTITPNDLEGNFQISDKGRAQRGKIKADVYDHATAKRKVIESETGGSGDDSIPDFKFPQTFGTDQEAQSAVNAKKRDLERKEKSFHGTFRTGKMGVAPGGILTSEGFGDDDDQDWVVSRRVFDFGSRGIVAKFEAEPKNSSQSSDGGG